MNRLWVRLSFAFSAVIVLAGIASFTILFVASWVIPQPQMTIDELFFYYEEGMGTYVEHKIVEGQNDEQIITDVQDLHDDLLFQIIRDKRLDGFAKGVDAQDRSLGRILSDFVDELLVVDGEGLVSFQILQQGLVSGRAI